MANFKVGDKVKCVDEGSGRFLTKNKIYTVLGTDFQNSVLIEDDSGDKSANFYSDRFVLVEKAPFEIYNKVTKEFELHLGNAGGHNLLMGTPSAKKQDSGKPPLSWIPLVALEQEAMALKFGANKYDEVDENGILRRNYKKGLDWSLLIDAALRHVNKFAAGQDNDDESSLSHLAHARANLAMLMYMIDKKIGRDDR